MRIAGHLVCFDATVHRIVRIEGVTRDDRRLHVLLFTGNDGRLPQPLLLRPREHVKIGGFADDNRDLLVAVLRQPARQVLLEDRPLVPAHAVDSERHERALQTRVQAQAEEHSHRDGFAHGAA